LATEAPLTRDALAAPPQHRGGSSLAASLSRGVGPPKLPWLSIRWLPQHPLQPPNQRPKIQPPPRHALRLLLRQLALPMTEQLAHQPRSAPRTAPPTVVESLRQHLIEHTRQLPRAQIAPRVEARIHSHERISTVVAEGRRRRQGLHVPLRQRRPRHTTTI